MIKHIVLWKLKEKVNGQGKCENALELKKKLEALNGKIPGMIWIEVGIHVPDSEQCDDDADVVLYSEFENQEALEAYYRNSAHKSIKPFVKSIREERRIINYEF